jgi:hypothetical protein
MNCEGAQRPLGRFSKIQYEITEIELTCVDSKSDDAAVMQFKDVVGKKFLVTGMQFWER